MKQVKRIKFSLIALLFLVLNSLPVSAQLATHRFGSPINFQVSGQNTAANFIEKYVLTNVSGVIQYTTNSLPFAGVALGQYKAYAVNYDGSQAIPTLTVGTNIVAIGGACVATSLALSIGVLDCNNTTGTISASISSQNTGTNFTQKYVLADSAGKILQITNTPQYMSLTNGIYNIYAINYETSSGVLGLTVNQYITGVTGNCVAISEPLGYLVCLVLTEICNNQLDDDGDGKIDGEDPDCTEPACDNTTGSITATIVGQNSSAGFTQKYILTDSTGNILQIVNTPSVSVTISGKYRLYSVNYETASGVTGLTVNQNITDVTGTCVNISLPLLYKVCLPTNQAPTITSAASVAFAENGIGTAYATTAIDPNAGQTFTFSFETGGLDNALFNINPTTGAVTFNTPPDFENPTDAGGNNVYNIKIKVCDDETPQLCALKDVAITVTDVAECNTPSVGGTTSTTIPLPVCSTLNAGNIVLIGQTGTVVKWQTSINGGGSWTDIAQTNTVLSFSNAVNNQQYRAVVSNGVLCADTFSSATTITTHPNPCCNSTDGNISATYTGFSTDPTHKNKFALTDTTGRILQITDTPQYSGLQRGWYHIYALTYDSTSMVKGLTLGADIDTLNGDCVLKTLPIPYKVCRNAIPVVNDTLIALAQDTLKNFCLAITDSDVGDTHTAVLSCNPTHGTVTTPSISGSQICMTYTPSAGFFGLDSVCLITCDATGACDTTSVMIQVAKTCLTFNLKVLLEGPYQTSTGKMTTILNQRGLLPGQTPIGQFASVTPIGQPYKGAPWNYAGTEGDTISTYPTTVTDWVLVSFRTDTTTTTAPYRMAGWLHEDGTITFPQGCINIPNGSYFILIEHRNHLGALSYRKADVIGNVVNFDFTIADSYVQINPPSFGQKLKGTTWVMYAADGKKDTPITNFDINFNDSQLWKVQSGIFDQYKFGDFNLDADVNFLDNQLWKINNGKYSGVPH